MKKVTKYVDAVRAGQSPPLPTIVCGYCERRVELWDKLEERFAEPDFETSGNELQAHAQRRIQLLAEERVLIADVISTVLLAGHKARELPVPEAGASLVVTLRGTPAREARVVFALSGDVTIRPAGTVFRGAALKLAKAWMASKVSIALVFSVDGKACWTDAASLDVDDGEALLNGAPLDAAAVESWGVKSQSLEQAMVEMRVHDAVSPSVAWTWQDKRFDVFLSFRGNEPFDPRRPADATVPAAETMRESVARPLAEELRTTFSVFFDEHALSDAYAATPGVTIDDILQGLWSTQGGGVAAVLLSRTYLRRKWTLIELAACAALHAAQQVRLVVFLLDVSASEVTGNAAVRAVCPALKDVPMRAVPANVRRDTVGLCAWVAAQVREAFGVPMLPVAGADAPQSFNRVLVAVARRLQNDSLAQASLVLVLRTPRLEHETLLDTLLRVPGLSFGNVTPLLAALEGDFRQTAYRDLIDLVRRYQFKWLAAWSTRSPAVDLPWIKAQAMALHLS